MGRKQTLAGALTGFHFIFGFRAHGRFQALEWHGILLSRYLYGTFPAVPMEYLLIFNS